jgi:CrcB protein
MLKTILLVGLGGGIGSALRYLTSTAINKFYGSTFPLATFVVNIIGCFIFGLLFAYFSKHAEQSEQLRFFLITGFCGGYTTFSTFSAENFQLIESGNYFIPAINITVSVLLGIAAVFLGIQIAK